MSSFKALQAHHESLIGRSQTGHDVQEEVQDFIEEVKASSSQIAASHERDQLRANLRYWASYVYERTGSYPNVDLAPAAPMRRANWLPFAVLGALLLVIIPIVFASLRLRGYAQVPPPTSTQAPAATEAPAITEASAATQPALETNTPVAVEPTQTIYVSQGNVIALQVTSVHNGDAVSPVTRLSGIYLNLPPGSSIHVLIQAGSKDAPYSPAKNHAMVAPNIASGEWAIEALFGQGAELKEKQDYFVSLVAATDETARQTLDAAAEAKSGLRELPSGTILFPETVSLSRPAFSAVIDGERLIYSSYLEDEGNFEIFSAEPDGSDPRRVTYTSGLSELFPSLSPDGKSIVYVGRRRDETNKPVFSLETINSDGTALTSLIEPQNQLTFESPQWSRSSDGAYLAYVSGTRPSTGQATWALWIYDPVNRSKTLLRQGDKVGPRYIAWIPNSHEIVFNTRLQGTSGFQKIDISDPKNAQPYYNGPGEELQPAISKDGASLAYMQLDNSIGNIYRVDLADPQPQQLTKNQFMGSSPAWGPDDKVIFFQFYANNTYNIWSVPAKGGRLTQITFGAQEMYPSVGYMYALVP